MPKSPHILIAGGGSLGCVYPGLSIARQVLARWPRARITLAGDGRAIERHTVRGVGHRYAVVPSASTPRRLVEAPGYALRCSAGWCVAHWLLWEQEVDLVVSIGGHAAGPIVAAARSRGVPFVLVEQSCLPHPATRRFAADAAAVCLAYPETGGRLPPETLTRVTGPVGRPGFEDDFGGRPGGRTAPRPGDGRPRMVVLGGVAGSTSLNVAAPAALSRLAEVAAGWQVVHQAGAGWLTATQQRYDAAGVRAVVVTYIDELAHLAREADLVVTPPGGSILAELALAGLPAVLVPDSRRRDGLHEANARLASLRTGSPVVSETDGDLALSLAEGIGPMLADPEAREAVARRWVRLARPEASALVAEACWEALGWSSAPRLHMAA